MAFPKLPLVNPKTNITHFLPIPILTAVGYLAGAEHLGTFSGDV